MYVQIVAIVGSLVLFGVVIDFIRRGLLKEKYSVLWLALCVAVMVLAVKRSILDTIALKLGVSYPPSLLFLVAFLFILLILLHFSVVISILHEKNKILAQEITMLRHIVKQGRDAGTSSAPESLE
ncbi:MAG: hypothetical protein A3J24_12690 [Deltaproteobacteria bacterium RIFCSPLOWO2_02_FULL_53_8]|nr:MAG: hypothetical protein A3J24_12690 [Deltaproteobacteria bacterium RIFCSPLOWO2_02_FULL_53_8]